MAAILPDLPSQTLLCSIRLAQLPMSVARRDDYPVTNIINDQGVISVGVGTQPTWELTLNLRTGSGRYSGRIYAWYGLLQISPFGGSIKIRR